MDPEDEEPRLRARIANLRLICPLVPHPQVDRNAVRRTGFAETNGVTLVHATGTHFKMGWREAIDIAFLSAKPIR